jgi:hypothetical protein
MHKEEARKKGGREGRMEMNRHGGISSNDLTPLRKKMPGGGKHRLKICTELYKTICTFSKKNCNRHTYKIKIQQRLSMQWLHTSVFLW